MKMMVFCDYAIKGVKSGVYCAAIMVIHGGSIGFQ